MDADGLRSDGQVIRVIADRLNLLGAHAPAGHYRRVAAELDAHWSQDRVCPVSIAVDFLGDLIWASPDATTREAAHAEAVNHLYEAALERGGLPGPRRSRPGSQRPRTPTSSSASRVSAPPSPSSRIDGWLRPAGRGLEVVELGELRTPTLR